MKILATLACVALAVGAVGAARAAETRHLQIELESGTVLIRLRPDLAPAHVARVSELADAGFYDGIVFHRVIPGFMAQTGDPTGTGRGGSGQNLAAEFSNETFRRGTVGMARAQDPDSADSQFFICFDDASFLDGQYTVFGEVIEGMQHVDAIRAGDPARNGVVADPDRMLRVRTVGPGDSGDGGDSS